MKKKLKLATLWLDGCSGCHMSLVDVDERLIEVAEIYDIVFSPLVDVKDFPENVDVTLLEGAISTDEDVEMVKRVRKSTKTLIAFGDCAVTSNVPSMRNHFKLEDVFKRGYLETTPGNDIFRMKKSRNCWRRPTRCITLYTWMCFCKDVRPQQTTFFTPWWK